MISSSDQVGLIHKPNFVQLSESSLRRVFDFSLSLCGLIVLSPLMLAVMVAIALEDGRPFFYLQERVGRKGKRFFLIKFRSMIKNAEAKTGPVFSQCGQDQRITKVGRIMRATALDELPQLINIFKGDMSFVGPRSERPFFVEQFKKEIPDYDKRHVVRPGLTGVAQVFGRYNTTARNKLRYDFLSLKHRSLRSALRLILKSFAISFRGKWTSLERDR